ncbi:type II secretion system F family protein [Pseudarthrobacter phenanthrenivorans]|jgi:pilus assembly protein TadC|uniref:Secretion system protein n=1 Tax=Pseudarthrobacter phenanthrenivorans TaxID=361575 RepID=A0A0B4DDU1_PSEPS|nr:type II secretion system F family protein [Pseudarthrobacter phenanthrenivorans]KIC66857.1 secretion system protein [Pseudarthrobacter phenanthrenivorans]
MTPFWPSGIALFLLLAAGACLVCRGQDASRRRLRHLAGGTPLGRQAATEGPATETGSGLKDTAMMLELVAAMLDAGASIARSLELLAASASPRYRDALRPVVSALAIGADWHTAWRSSAVRLPEVLELREALGFAALTGAPSSAILYAQAARLRRERFRAAEKRAASLGVKLVVPLGLCSLPAFICLGVVPVLLALVPSGS